MAYNNLPMSYFPYGQQNFMPQQQMAPVPQPVQQPAIQNGGIINVQSEQEARDYLVAQGTSVTFVNGNEQKIYIKTRGFSSLDKPTFETYRLVKENNEEPEKTAPIMSYVEKHDFDTLKADVEALKEKIGGNNEQSDADNANAKSV